MDAVKYYFAEFFRSWGGGYKNIVLPAKLGTFSLFFNLEEHVDYVSVLCQAGLKRQNLTKKIKSPAYLSLFGFHSAVF